MLSLYRIRKDTRDGKSFTWRTDFVQDDVQITFAKFDVHRIRERFSNEKGDTTERLQSQL